MYSQTVRIFTQNNTDNARSLINLTIGGPEC